MTPHRFYEWLSTEVTGPTQVTLAPGPVILRVNQHDALAARLLLWLAEAMPEDATSGDLHDPYGTAAASVLDVARWWSTFWAALPHDETAAKPTITS